MGGFADMSSFLFLLIQNKTIGLQFRTQFRRFSFPLEFIEHLKTLFLTNKYFLMCSRIVEIEEDLMFHLLNICHFFSK
jgi:hypothetical protein